MLAQAHPKMPCIYTSIVLMVQPTKECDHRWVLLYSLTKLNCTYIHNKAAIDDCIYNKILENNEGVANHNSWHNIDEDRWRQGYVLVSVPDPKRTLARIAFSITRTESDTRAGWGLGMRLGYVHGWLPTDQQWNETIKF